MRIGFILLFVNLGCLCASNVYAQKAVISMKYNSIELKDALTEIEKQTEFSFVYDSHLVDINQRVSVNISKDDIFESLGQLFKNVQISYRVIDRKIILTASVETKQEQRNGVRITGVVLDVAGLPLIGATVLEKGTTNGVISDVDGKFSLKIAKGSVLQISYIGYNTQEINVDGEKDITITLEEDSKLLDEIVIIGYGAVKKNDLTGAVASIKMNDVSSVGVTSIDRALQGQISGVVVNNKTGQPGEGMSIRIRGGNSISGSNEPLYVIDGLPVEGINSTINPEDILSMEILKDASSTAIYGSRGANGVVLITTKRGSNKETIVSYNGYVGWQSLRNKIDLLGKDDYIDMVNTVAVNDGGSIQITPAEAALLPDNDWQDLAYETALLQSHQLSISGGNESSSIYASIGFLEQDGVIKNSGFKRISMRLNADQKISDKFKLTASMSYNHGTKNNANSNADGGGAISYSAMVMAPIDNIFNEDGSYTVFTGTPWGGTNPVGMAEHYYNRSTDSRILANMGLDYDIIDGLKLRITAGGDFSSSTDNTYVPIGIVTGGSTQGKANKSKANTYSIVNENILTYNKGFNNGHKLDALGGVTFQTYDYDYINGNSQGFLSDIYVNNNLGVGADAGKPGSGLTEHQMVSFLARVNYNIKDRYLFTVTGRYDGSSKFGKNNKFAFFPSAAFAWRISEESFMEDVSWIHNLKLRASYGVTGNQAISPYQTLAKLGSNSPVFDNSQDVGFVLSSMGNDDLKWETTTQIDIGVDFAVLDGKLSFSADYYKKQTDDLLYNVRLPSSSGYSSMVRNIGSIDNEGFEFSLTSVNIDRAVSWITDFNISVNKSTVKNLGVDSRGEAITRVDAPIAGGNWFPLFLGEAPFQLYGYEIEGIYQSKDEAIENGEANKQAGDYKYKNINGDNIVNSQDKKLISDLEPDFTFGMTNSIKYKGVELSFLIIGSFGNDIVSEFNKSYTVATGQWNMRTDVWNDMWSEDNRDAKYARASMDTKGYVSDGDPSSVWVEDGSYLRFKDIRLSYTIPKSIFRNFKRKPNISIYMSGQNLITFTNYSHYDPEASWTSSTVNGWDRGVYPSYKSYTFGTQIIF